MLRHAVTGMALCFFVTACGSSDNPSGGGGSSNAGAAGMSSNGGASMGGSGTAGSGSGVLRGAISINLQSGNGCALTAQTQDYPTVSSGHPVTAAIKGVGIGDKEPDSNGVPASVGCAWYTDSPPYQIQAAVSVSQGGSHRTAGISSRVTSGSTSTGTMTFVSKELPSADGYESASCTFSVIQLDPATRSVWGSFTCDSLTDYTNPTGCTVAPSYFFFDNCKKP